MAEVENRSDADIEQAKESAAHFAQFTEKNETTARFLSLLHAEKWIVTDEKYDKLPNPVRRENKKTRGEALDAFCSGQLGDPESILAEWKLPENPEMQKCADVMRDILARAAALHSPRKTPALGFRIPRRLAPAKRRNSGGRIRCRHRQPALGAKENAGSGMVCGGAGRKLPPLKLLMRASEWCKNFARTAIRWPKNMTWPPETLQLRGKPPANAEIILSCPMATPTCIPCLWNASCNSSVPMEWSDFSYRPEFTPTKPPADSFRHMSQAQRIAAIFDFENGNGPQDQDADEEDEGGRRFFSGGAQ